MKAMIMAAGVGTRLMPLTTDIPKPMVPVVNKPVMAYCVELLKEHGITEIIANTHYRPEVITDYFKDGRNFGVKMLYSYEKELLGTAGGVKNNRYFLDQTFVVISGDALTNINLTKMLEFHREKKALVTLALTPVEEVSNYGVVVLNENGKILQFQEKPKKEEALSNMVNTGIYIFEPEIFDHIPDGFYDFGKELFPKLAAEGQAIFGYVTEDYWCDVGDLEVYKEANKDVARGLYPVQKKFKEIDTEDICQSVTMQGYVVIGKDCKIGKNVILKDCIIWDGCDIGDGAEITDSIIANGEKIEDGEVVLTGSVVKKTSHI